MAAYSAPGKYVSKPNLNYNPILATMDRNDLDYSKFHIVYTEFQPKILRYVSNLVGEADAEDITQDIFVKVSRALPDFRGDCKLSTWLYRIATNAGLDRLRNPAHQKKMATILEESVDNIDDRNIWSGEKVPVLEWQLVRKEMGTCVQEYIRKLPENYRLVLALSELEGFSNKEVADILGITTGTVKIRLHRARERLKKDLIANCPSYWVDGNEFLPDLKNL